MSQVAVIDYGMGNLHSVASALQLVAPSAKVVVTNDAAIIEQADRVIFPGVGAMRDCMAEIIRLGLDKTLKQQIDSGKPILAICVGMQALMASSDENNGVPCLNFLPGAVKSFSDDEDFQKANLATTASERLKVPHMGWNQVTQTVCHRLWQDIANDSRFYFVHSYFVETSKSELIAGHATHGIEFTAALAKKNLFAVQFHPEKSQDAGLQLLQNFMYWDGKQ